MDNAKENVGRDETIDKLKKIRVKSLRLAQRLGQTASHPAMAQILYRLGLTEQLRGGHVDAFNFNHAWAMAEQLELAGKEPLDFSCTIMVLGKSGLETNQVKDVVGTVNGIKVRLIDTPGLLPLWSDQQRNRKMLHSVKRFIERSSPDVVLYFDRLNYHDRNSDDELLLQTITNAFGPSIWVNTIVVFTHAASATPEGPDGVATDYNRYVTERSLAVQRAIRRVSEMMLMNPVALVENHLACRTDRAGRRVLPNGLVWKPHLLMLCFASKILGEANELLKSQNVVLERPYRGGPELLPVTHVLTSLLQPKAKLKLPLEEYDIDDNTLDDNLDEVLESDDDLNYDELPPFKPLTRSQVAKLSKSQQEAYYDELDYREKLYVKKQLQDLKQWRMMKKMEAEAKEFTSDQSTGGEAHEPLPVIDCPVPDSFDSDDPVHRYRFSTNQVNVGPVKSSDTWDHVDGYEGVYMNKLIEVMNKVPISFTGRIKKNKKEALFAMEVTGFVKHGKKKETTISFDLQQIDSDIAYTIRSDTTFSNFRRNKATAGLSVTRVGDALSAGVRVEDKIMVSRRSQVVMMGAATTRGSNVAYAGGLEATLRDKQFPLGRALTTMSFDMMACYGGFLRSWNAKSQIPIGRFTDFIGGLKLNNSGEGQVSIGLKSTEYSQLALLALVPLLSTILTRLFARFE
ncbi:translocase of chloroplast 132, chloroplastic [Daucus carota subsp. sativus]|uniref:Uncharacterized protein n=1 Tax=Daucus carota subsp. sativus TaxID=79200 RepID=A0A166HY94_DAUCS|nr:PREDICTED: translocase of chloroplast 132, chloroplastic-like [Daucus carota subsp. sativus]